MFEGIGLWFAARRLSRTLKLHGFSEARSSEILEYYLLPFWEYTRIREMRLDVRDWIIRQLNSKVQRKLKVKRRRSLRKTTEETTRQ